MEAVSSRRGEKTTKTGERARHENDSNANAPQNLNKNQPKFYLSALAPNEKRKSAPPPCLYLLCPLANEWLRGRFRKTRLQHQLAAFPFPNTPWRNGVSELSQLLRAPPLVAAPQAARETTFHRVSGREVRSVYDACQGHALRLGSGSSAEVVRVGPEAAARDVSLSLLCLFRPFSHPVTTRRKKSWRKKRNIKRTEEGKQQDKKMEKDYDKK